MQTIIDALERAMPFAAVLSAKPPVDRPLLTRAAELAIVAVLGALGALEVRTNATAEDLKAIKARLVGIEADVLKISRDHLAQQPHPTYQLTPPQPAPKKR